MADKTQVAQLVTEPTTKPPDDNKPYIPLLVDGKEVWFLLQEDDEEGITPADFDFERGKKWAEQQDTGE